MQHQTRSSLMYHSCRVPLWYYFLPFNQSTSCSSFYPTIYYSTKLTHSLFWIFPVNISFPPTTQGISSICPLNLAKAFENDIHNIKGVYGCMSVYDYRPRDRYGCVWVWVLRYVGMHVCVWLWIWGYVWMCVCVSMGMGICMDVCVSEYGYRNMYGCVSEY